MASNLTPNTSLAEFGVGLPLPEPLRIVLIIFGVAMVTVGVPGNLLIIVTVLKIKTIRIQLNMFIINLAIADTLMIGYIFPFTLIDVIQGRYPVKEKHCLINFVILHTALTTEFLTVTLIAISRYTKVCRTVSFNRVFRKKGTMLFCLASWLLGPLSSIRAILNPTLVDYSKYAHVCWLRTQRYTFLLVSFILVPAYVITLLCYWKLYRHVKECDRNIRNHGNETFARLRHNLNRSQILGNFVIFVLNVFLQSPFAVTYLAFPAAPVCIQTTFLFLFAANNSINCIVYGAMNKNIWKSYKRVLPTITFIQVQRAPTNS